MNRIARERGFPQMDRSSFEESRSVRGANFVGSPDEVAEKILFQHEIFGHERFLLQMIAGGMPHGQIMHSIELFGTKVAPQVRRALGQRNGTGSRRADKPSRAAVLDTPVQY
jgi:alkanesulfonate monooxygenase SsuD/methylene tetrahydromethanopterin reductase-like flavin-dependent oxidoreductase (luciferase family)